ncbi:MAG: ATP-binding protein [Candidatus Woesearchaeota archaeon]
MKNKRTLKKRVRKIVALCIFVAILLFGIFNIFINAELTKKYSSLYSEFYTYTLANEMNSKNFIKLMEINSLKNLKKDNPYFQKWFNEKNKHTNLHTMLINQRKNINTPLLTGVYVGLDEKQNDSNEFKAGVVIHPHTGKIKTNFTIRLLDRINFFVTSIKLNSETLVTSREQKQDYYLFSFLNEKDNNFFESFLKKGIFFYEDIKSSYPLYDKNNNQIGKVTTTVNPELSLMIFLTVTIGIIITGFISLIISLVLSKILTIPVSKPLSQLETKLNAIAAENYRKGQNKKVVLKRPLKEIKSIADSTNKIITNMKKYSDLVTEQKEELKDKNIELNAQNQELEAQKEEIEAQNEELIESQRKIEKAQTQLVQSEKMASIGQLTAAITHEINTPIGTINSNVQMFEILLKKLSENELVKNNKELAETVKQIDNSNQVVLMACKRVRDIIRSLKNFATLDQAEFQKVNIIESLKSVLVLTSNLWKNKITIHQDYENLPQVKCYPGLLNQVFMNIIVNSIHAIENKGDIYIKAKDNNNYVQIHIKDNGSGIDEEHLAKIFDYGFTTKKNGEGMGVGLAICQSIIDKHDGEIKVNSKPGKGTEFIIKIPKK